MACPMCQVLLAVDDEAARRASVCPSCSAAWIAAGSEPLEAALAAIRNWPADAPSATLEFPSAAAAHWLCPECSQTLEVVDAELVAALRCTGCEGRLVPGLVARRIAGVTARRTLACPLCAEAMWVLDVPGKEPVDVCPVCSATWFDWDDGALETALQGAVGWPPFRAGALDEFGERVDEIECPVCKVLCEAFLHGGYVSAARCPACWGELIPGVTARRIAGDGQRREWRD